MKLDYQSLSEKDTALYYGNSMRRVFVTCDKLVLKDIPFADFQRGDIVAFCIPGASHGIVHRIVARTDSDFITMGDNNPGPDKHRVTMEDRPRLVIARSPVDWSVHAVWRGRAGMLQFRVNRIRRFFRRCASKAWRLAKATARLFVCSGTVQK